MLGLRTHDGRYLAPHVTTKQLVATDDRWRPELNICVKAVDQEHVVLFSPATQHAVAFEEDGLVPTTRPDRANQQALFTKVELGQGRCALKNDRGYYLSVLPGLPEVAAFATQPGQHELFTIEEKPGLPEEAGRLSWYDEAHKWLVYRAVEILRHHAGSVPGAQRFMEYWNLPEFQRELLAGVHDADYDGRYVGTLWSAHFYDPQTQRNIFNYSNPSALGQAVRYFGESLDVRRIGRRSSLDEHYAYLLGVSLHFFADLAQPMHAANIAARIWWDNPGFHQAFEVYVDELVKDAVRAEPYILAPSAVTVQELVQWRPSTTALALEVARKGRALWDLCVERARRGEMPTTPVLKEIMFLGQRYLAYALVNWAEKQISLECHLPFSTRPEHTGRWAFKEGSWWFWYNANQYATEQPPRFTEMADGSFVLEGDYSFNPDRHRQGHLRMTVRMGRGGLHEALVAVEDTGNMLGVSYETTAQVETRDPLIYGTVRYYNAQGFEMTHSRFMKSPTWYPGLEFTITISGKTYHLCWENMQLSD